MSISVCGGFIDAQGKELIAHGTAQFPIACYEDDLEAASVPWHWHEELELLIVAEGTAVIATGNEKHIAKKGQGYFVNAQILHAMWDTTHSNCRFHSIVFHPRLAGGSRDSVFWQKYIVPLVENRDLSALFLDGSKEWHGEILNFIETIWQYCKEEPEGYELQVRHLLSQILFRLVKYHPIPLHGISEKEFRDAKRIKQMLQYVEEHYAEDINAGEIAQSAAISESECLRCFHKTIGITPIQYLKQFRLQKAENLLAETDWRVTKICSRCGISNSSYFTKIFREYKGCTPVEYRKRSRGNRQGADIGK